jgi:CRISPR-associated endonuclease Csn1
VIEAIREWIASGRPADSLPRSPAGDEIRKVRLRTKGKPAVQVRGGTADRGEIVRVDVFARPNKRGKDDFYLVPIYPHHVTNKRDWPMPPMRAVVAHKDEEDWTLIDHSFAFRFSLYPRNFVEVVKSTGEVFEGYFGGMDRSTGAITLQSHNDPKNSFRGLGAKTLLTMKKYSVDRFGVRSEVTASSNVSEPRLANRHFGQSPSSTRAGSVDLQFGHRNGSGEVCGSMVIPCTEEISGGGYI